MNQHSDGFSLFPLEISIKPIPVPYPTILGVIPRTTVFQQCPHLRKVTFAFAAHAVDLADFNLPWHQLTHLDVHSCSLREYECLGVLRQCTALEECSISTFSTPARDLYKVAILSRDPVVLPSLLSLSLNLGDLVGYSVHFVYALRLPRLRSLRPSSQVSLYPALLPAFWRLLSETIRHLDFPGWIPIDLPTALALVPNLETLELQDSDSRVLETLGGGAVPHLVTLRLGIVNLCDLFDMLEARTAAARAGGGVAVLSDVSAIDSGTVGVDITRLYALRAAGVQVVFRNWSL
ncbi:hypothetical protein BD779DRAFT_1471931 [Infundibulicybe gibba]|nr:hypothetical protein BD779DRAFT_1471931 [Infundibulicybe gibba]